MIDHSSALPIAPLLPRLRDALGHGQFAVVEAAPGAGKTTAVPVELYEQRSDDPRQVIVTEPRRIAARLAATHVAQKLGSAVGGLVGYSVRFEERSSARTRIRYATEGVLLQLLQSDPALACAHTVVLDEFHERHIATDQLLALLYHLCKSRTELRLVVMSATLEAGPVATFLDDCPHLSSEGRCHPIEIRHQLGPDDRPLDKRVASAVRSALREQPTGHVLVFLPGAREIQRARGLLAPHDGDFSLHVLHGEMPIAEQAATIAPSARRKVILATNVAESSVTIDGVTAVVDSGLVRMAAHSPWSGRPTLQVVPISRSSAVQRAGRAGRTAAGLVVRLYEHADLQRRPEHDPPEIERLDLTELVLRLRGLGHTPERLDWLSKPNPQSLRAAQGLLRRLGALDDEQQLTELGRRMLRHPVVPRLSRVLVAAEDAGIADDGCLAVALLSERDIRRPPGPGDWDLPTGPSDLEERMEVFRELEYERFRPGAMRAAGLDEARVRAVDRAYRQLSQKVTHREHPRESSSVLLRRALLTAYADRVALHQPKNHRLILADGGTATVSPRSVVREAPLVVALELEERGERRDANAQVQWLSAIEPDWLLEMFEDLIELRDELRFDAERQRVESVSRLSYGSVTLEESRLAAPPSAETSRLLHEAALQRLSAWTPKGSSTERLRQRVGLLEARGIGAPWPNLDELTEGRLLSDACSGKTSFAELSLVNLEELALTRLSNEQQRLLAAEAPTHVTLPCGRRLEVHYEPGKPPWVASRLQDFFGMADGPRICRGRVALTLHLLAPNQRAVQVTSDLSGFWERHYAEVRKELRRRYAKHSFPEDGRTASPPPLRRIR